MDDRAATEQVIADIAGNTKQLLGVGPNGRVGQFGGRLAEQKTCPPRNAGTGAAALDVLYGQRRIELKGFARDGFIGFHVGALVKLPWGQCCQKCP